MRALYEKIIHSYVDKLTTQKKLRSQLLAILKAGSLAGEETNGFGSAALNTRS
jgi:hypothetical protein